MKTLLLWTPVLALAIALTGCTKNYTNPGVTFTETVKSTDWTLDPQINAYYVDIPNPALDDAATQYDAVVVAIGYTDPTNNNTYSELEAIPEVYQGVAYSYTYSTGRVSLYAQGSDGSTLASAPAEMVVKISLIPSNPH